VRETVGLLPFVASYSADRDNLTQWRSYCPKGNGVCIGFRTDSLSNAFLISPERSNDDLDDNVSVEFRAIKYLDPLDVSAVDEMIRHALNVAADWSLDDREIKEAFNENYRFWLDIEAFAAITKHISFEAERESRLVVWDSCEFDGSLHYRASRSTLIPYVMLGLADPKSFLGGVGHKKSFLPISDQFQPYFIDNVTIGPTPHPGLSKDSLDSLFDQANRDVVVHSSEVPYRDW
jgi:hypothetical protein